MEQPPYFFCFDAIVRIVFGLFRRMDTTRSKMWQEWPRNNMLYTQLVQRQGGDVCFRFELTPNYHQLRSRLGLTKRHQNHIPNLNAHLK